MRIALIAALSLMACSDPADLPSQAEIDDAKARAPVAPAPPDAGAVEVAPHLARAGAHVGDHTLAAHPLREDLEHRPVERLEIQLVAEALGVAGRDRVVGAADGLERDAHGAAPGAGRSARTVSMTCCACTGFTR